MKTQIFRVSLAGLAAAIMPFVSGCDAEAIETAESANAETEAPTSLTANTNAAKIANLPQPAEELAVKPEPAPPTPEQKTLPPNLNPSSPAAEIVKLAQAGVDEAVLLSYVTNSTKVFGLGSDEIIYLNDLGVPGSVVTTMIEHDKALKQFWANANQPQTVGAAPAPTPEPPAEQTATAPSYVNPPPPVAVEPQPAVVNNNYFYDTLSPYGTWIDVDGYGRCWQPTVVVGNRNWQPYSDRGRWVYSDCGWYWLSDYSWGATAFHYGRWFNHSRWGWCWYPDRVWGPSWVTWRYSGDYCGWAPLPPAAIYRPGLGFRFHDRWAGFSVDFGVSASWYTFVPTSRFCDPRPSHYRASRTHVTQIYNNTTIINNFGSGNNNTVINRGIDPDRIRSVSRTEIRQVALRDAPQGAGKGRSERLDRDGRTLLVNRPHFSGNGDDSRRGGFNTAKPSVGEPARQGESPRNQNSRPGATTPSREHRDEQRSGRPRSGFAAEKSAVPTGSTAPAPANPNVTTASPTPKPAVPTMNTPRPAAEHRQPGNDREPNRNGSVPPLIVRGTERVQPGAPPTPASPAQPNTPAGPVVIGKPNTSSTPGRSPFTTYSSPTGTRPEARPAQPRNNPAQQQIAEVTPPPTRVPSVTRNWSPTAPVAPATPAAPQTSTRQDNYRGTRNFESRNTTQPTYTAPAPVQRQSTPVVPAPSVTPRFSTPAPSASPSFNRSPAPSAPRSQPAPTFSAPRAQNYSAPASSTPAPASRFQSAPAPSPAPAAPAPSRSDSGSRGRDRR